MKEHTPEPEKAQKEFQLREDARHSSESATSETDSAPWNQPPIVADEAPGALPANPPVVSITTESFESRLGLGEWLGYFLMVVIALAIISVFNAITAAILHSPPNSLDALVSSVRTFALALPDRLQLLTEPRLPGTFAGHLTAFECFCFGIVFLMLAVRLILRARLLSAIYVWSGRWNERTGVGMVLCFFGLLAQILLLAWGASVTRVATTDNWVIGSVLAAVLLTGALWMFLLQLVSHGEIHGLLGRAVGGTVFGLAIVLAMFWPEIVPPWTQAGTVIVLGLIESLAAFFFAAEAALEDNASRAPKQKPLFLVAGFVILILIGGLLAITR